MERIDTSGWKEFRLDSVFVMKNTKSIVQKDVKPDSGTVPYVTASNSNNGVMMYIDCPPEWIDCGDCIMIGGKTMTFSYQKEPFCSNDSHNIALYLKDKTNATEMCYLFLITALRSALYSRYSWGDSVSMKRIKDDVFFLPTTEDGKPDYAYMDQYMRDVMEESEASLENLRQADKARHLEDTQSWKPFCLGELFDVEKGTRLTKADQRDGDINFISASSFNNGIAATISNDEHVHPGNTMTVSYNGSDIGRTFYQEEPFWASDDVNVLYPKFQLTKNIALFIAPIIKAVGGSHVYKNKWLQEDMKVAEIMLPVAMDGKPDWDYMDTYMSKMLETTSASLDVLAEAVN